MKARVIPAGLGLITVLGASGACRSTQASSLEHGRALYAENGCANCHGTGGHGDGPVGKTLDPRPRDFRDATAFKRGTDVASIATAIAEGVRGGGKMPRFEHLSQAERRSLALFVMSLRDLSEKGSEQP